MEPPQQFDELLKSMTVNNVESVLHALRQLVKKYNGFILCFDEGSQGIEVRIALEAPHARNLFDSVYYQCIPLSEVPAALAA